MGMELFSDQGEGALDSLLRPYLDERDYYGAMNAYLDSAEKTLSHHSTLKEGDKTTSLPSTYSEATGESVNLPTIVLIRGIAIGLASAFASMAILLMTGVH